MSKQLKKEKIEEVTLDSIRGIFEMQDNNKKDPRSLVRLHNAFVDLGNTIMLNVQAPSDRVELLGVLKAACLKSYEVCHDR